jgi:hypothetical protein
MAGAVQTAPVSTGFALDYGVEGFGTVTVENEDPDGMYSGTVTLNAAPSGGGHSFSYWLVNDVIHPTKTTPLALVMDGHKTVRAVFSAPFVVTTTNDSGDGSMRKAIQDALDAGGGTIYVDLPAEDNTITLDEALPTINKDITIEGNGCTLTPAPDRSGFRFIEINNSGGGATRPVIRISRIHFKGARYDGYVGGGAVGIYYYVGAVHFVSCIFSDNQTAQANGGAIVTSANQNQTLTVTGCTFYNNRAPAGSGGAIYVNDGGVVVLTGNIFQGNTASAFPVYKQHHRTWTTFTTGGYNVSDSPDGDWNSNSGWTFATTDTQLTGVSFDAGFKPSHANLPVISPPEGFPAEYFNGAPRGPGSVPGAMPAQ